MINSNDKIILDSKLGNVISKEDRDEELKEKSPIELSGLRCIKTMNSSFIDFYKTYEEEDLVLNKEDNLMQNSNLIESRKASSFSRSEKRIIFHLI